MTFPTKLTPVPPNRRNTLIFVHTVLIQLLWHLPMLWEIHVCYIPEQVRGPCSYSSLCLNIHKCLEWWPNNMHQIELIQYLSPLLTSCVHKAPVSEFTCNIQDKFWNFISSISLHNNFSPGSLICYQEKIPEIQQWWRFKVVINPI
jgi:hypothetical protein